ncbi:TPA: ABC transporter ATP-binding protein [Candidatus Poribacteria bacterium]|nr:ABC transporter ATP-binding protein [Candidatus Poribacteria bacterium]
MRGSEFHSFEEEDEHAKVYDSKLMRRLLTYLGPYKLQIVAALILIIAASVVMLAGPYLTKIAIDDYIRPLNLKGLEFIIFLYVLTLVMEATLNYAKRYVTQMIGQKVMYDIRMQLFSHLQRLHVGFFDRNPVGRLMTRVMGDVSVLNDLFTSGVIEVFGDLFSILGIMVVMFTMNWQLALVTYTVIPIILIATLIFQIKVRRAYREGRRQLARVNAFLEENLVGMTTVQTFCQERRSFEKFDERNQAYLNANLHSVLYYSMFFPIVEVTGAIATALIIWYGGGKIIQNAMTIGALVAFIQYSARFFWPIRSLTEKYNILQSAMAASERIFGLLDTEPLIIDSQAPVKVDKIKGQIEFKDVWFAYNDGDYVLKGISFEAKEGEKVAIVGATGAGKTSIINLLCRFYEVNKGQILIDGVDIRDMELDKLHRSIGIVQQDVFLFSGTIEGNIRLGNKDISPQTVVHAAQSVHADYFIKKLPELYQSEIKERGSTFSVGQKQLIAFARALAYDPEILILDEATSSVDTETELLIQDALKRLMYGRTSIVIAHRLSTIQNADKIIVMHKGEIREIGDHWELLRRRGIYYRLYQLQYKGQEVIAEAASGD